MREIDLREVFFILLRHVWIILSTTLVMTVAALAITHFCITPQYTASIKLYVNNSVEVNSDITSSDVSASKSLVDTYATIIRSDTVLDAVIEKTGVDYSTKQLAACMTAGALNNTEVFQVSITTPDPVEASKIANAIADEAPNVLAYIVTGSSVKIVDRAKTPTAPSSPSYMKNTAIGLLLGVVLSCGAVLLLALLDTRIKTDADLALVSSLPVLGAITEFHAGSKAGYGYGAYRLKGEDKRL